MEINLIKNSDEGRYEAHVDGQLAFVEYKEKEGKVYLVHTEVAKELEGKGVAGKLVEKVLQDIKADVKKVVPRCSYVATYIKKHPEWERLVAE